MTSVHGIVVTRNDWGTSAVAISHAMHIVDVVHVLDHGSSDQTAQGLAIMQQEWGDRLKVVTASEKVPFNQRVLTNMLASSAENAGADWIYPFDSDEFLLVNDPAELIAELDALEPQFVALQYSVHNYISLRDFDRNILSGYRQLQFRARPNRRWELETALAMMRSGESTFFDYAFPNKLIFRANRGLLVSVGSHWLPIGRGGAIAEPRLTVQCAHVPFVSREVLARKSENGKAHRELGRPPSMGWHNQFIYQMEIDGQLDSLWNRHSINLAETPSNWPSHENDDSLVNAVECAITSLNSVFGDDLSAVHHTPLVVGAGDETLLDFSEAFSIAQFFDSRITIDQGFRSPEN